jgi:hypothetical protein
VESRSSYSANNYRRNIIQSPSDTLFGWADYVANHFRVSNRAIVDTIRHSPFRERALGAHTVAIVLLRTIDYI